MAFTLLIWSCQLIFITAVSCRHVDFQKLIDEVNSVQSTWEAGHNFDRNVSIESLRRLTSRTDPRNLIKTIVPRVISYESEPMDIPKSFDSRKHWRNCPSFKQIGDCGACSANWAIATAEAFTDRLCVATKGKVKAPRSTQELLSCCSECVEGSYNGCKEGYAFYAWEYLINNGLATGGKYNSGSGCQPYQFEPCNHKGLNGQGSSKKKCSDIPLPNVPKCVKSCTNTHYKKKFKEDHRYMASQYYFATIEDVQKDIMKYGSVTTDFLVYTDFLTYKSGVYSYTTGDYIGGNTVRLIGWGVEKGVDYWIAANHWNSGWGDKGFFKIRKGTDECLIELTIIGGQVKN